MKKIPTLYLRDWEGDRSRVLDQVTPGCEWVIEGKGFATEKIDGTCVTILHGHPYKRREIKRGEKTPPGFVLVEGDDETGKFTGWVPIDFSDPADQWHLEALGKLVMQEGRTYELLGPKVRGNPYGMGEHLLLEHGSRLLNSVPTRFAELRDYLASHPLLEGIVWWQDSPEVVVTSTMVKIKRRDFGLKWPESKA